MPARPSIDLAAQATADLHKVRDTAFDGVEGPLVRLFWLAVLVCAAMLAPVAFVVFFGR